MTRLARRFSISPVAATVPLIAIVVVAFVSGGCAPRTQLLVRVTAAEGLPHVAVVVAEIRDAGGAVVDGPRGFDFTDGEISFAVVPRGDDASRVVEIVVTGCAVVPEAGACNDESRIARSFVRTSFLRGRAVTVHVELSGPCTDVACPEGHVCRADGPAHPCEPLVTAVDAATRPALDASADGASVDAIGPADAGCVSTDARPSDARFDAGPGCRSRCTDPAPYCVHVTGVDASIQRAIPSTMPMSLPECLAALGVPVSSDIDARLVEAFTPTCGPMRVEVVGKDGGFRPQLGWYWADEDPRTPSARHPLGPCPTTNWACGEPGPAAIDLDPRTLPGARPGRELGLYLHAPRPGIGSSDACTLPEGDTVVLATDRSRSSDPSVPHAVAYADPRAADTWIVGFEDLIGGGDLSYDDVVVRVSGVTAGCAP